MKIKQFIALAILFTLTFSACETTFDLDAEYEDITIVYGLLEKTEDGQSDSVFIKVTKAFLGGDAAQVALIRDSSEYQNKLDVTLTQYKNGNQVGDPIVFDSISRYNKQDTTQGGDFYFPDHQMYYAIMPVDEDSKYDLHIVRNDKVITSETNIVNSFTISKPGQSIGIDYVPESKMKFTWSVSYFAKSYEAIIRFHFKEVWEGVPDTVYRYIDWYLVKRVNETVGIGDNITLYYQADMFYVSVENTVPYYDAQKEAKVLERYSGDAQYIVYAATDELTTYVNVNNAGSTSIVLERPAYTNINNGLGLFSSRRYETVSKVLRNDTKDRLSNLNAKFVY